MTEIRRVLLTGHEGYIGSVMAPLLRQKGYDVVGLDTGYYAADHLVPATEIPTIRKDLRDLAAEDLRGIDAVIHLAGLSNDPIGNLNNRWTEEINHNSSVTLAQLAKAAGAKRFLFSSSCIMYGVSELAVVNEESPLAPQTEYARSKVRSEEEIRKMASDGFSPVYLRNGTIYGISPRMRFDTVLNNLTGSAVTSGKVVVMGDGKVWRPVSHVEDVCRYFAHVLAAPTEKIHNEAFNCGHDALNHEIIELARFALEAVPGSVLDVHNRQDVDQRTYKVNFDKFAKTFPDFKFHWDARRGALDLAATFRRIALTTDDFSGRRFIRLKALNHLRESGQLDESLRWRI